jgi:tetratricopeptide (TPR) repeat protein
MNVLLIGFLLQSLLLLPPRTATENPAAVSEVPAKIRKDYDKLWARFVSGKEDAKLVKDLDNLLKKQKTFDPPLTIEAYIELYKGNDAAARQKFVQALSLNSKNRIAIYYLAELAYAHSEYARATTLYAQLMSVDPSRSDLEPKRQRALLLATEEMLRSAARAEGENRLAEAEQYYRQALSIVPNEPVLHGRLADLLVKANKKDEADAERKRAEELAPRRPGRVRTPDETKTDTLEDLGRWGNDIELFHRIRSAEAITREQLAILIVRYFAQVTELRQNPQIVTDTQDSPARSEIQTVAGLGLIEPFANHTFEPATLVTRGDLAVTLARLIRLLSLSPSSAPPVPAPDLAPANAQYPEVQLVLGHGVMMLEDSGSFNAAGVVSGQEAVRAAERLLHVFQQAQR